MQPFMDFLALIRQHQYLFSKQTTEALHAYNAEMVKHMGHWRRKHEYEAIEEAGRASDRFLELVRSELGVG
jgi:hypothetical protein